MEHETFWDLATDIPHWEFEIFTTILFDILIGLLILPTLQRWFRHHKADDSKLLELENRVKLLENVEKGLQKQ